MSTVPFLLMSALGFHTGEPGEEPKANASRAASRISTSPSKSMSPAGVTLTRRPGQLLSPWLITFSPVTGDRLAVTERRPHTLDHVTWCVSVSPLARESDNVKITVLLTLTVSVVVSEKSSA